MAKSPAELLVPGRALTLSGVADGAEGLIVADLARAVAAKPNAPATSLVVICRDGPRMAQLARALSFFAPEIEINEFPAWDCLPYDRVSPHPGVVAQRMTTLSRLARLQGREKPGVVLTTVNAALQRVPPRSLIATQALSAAPGNMLAMDGVMQWLELNGYNRTSTVREPGDYAVRGGIVDLYPPGMGDPVRLDFFGDTLESIRSFDAETQRSQNDLRALDLVPVAEFQLTSETIRRFRQGYVEAFGTSANDPLYEAVSEGRRHPGMEHWLPLFHKGLDTLFDYVPSAAVALEPLAEDAAHERLAQITDYYEARRQALDADRANTVYKPLPPDRLYLSENSWKSLLRECALARLTPFADPDASSVDAGTHTGRNFAPERAEAERNVFDAVTKHVHALQSDRKRVVIAMWSEGSRERMSHVLADHGLVNLTNVANYPDALKRPKPEISLAVLGLEAGFETADLAVIAEQDILGDRLVRRRRASKRPEDFIAEVTSLDAGDLVVHVDHGIGRFAGLQTIEAAGAPHDCLELHYAEGAKLYLPVENIELSVALRLGGHQRPARQARRRRLADAQGAAEEPHPRDGGRADQDRGGTAAARGREAHRRARHVRGVLRRLPLRRDRGPGDRDQHGAGRSRLRQADGPAGVRRRRLRQDRGGAARRLHRGDERQAGRGRGADHAARAPALQDVQRALPRHSL